METYNKIKNIDLAIEEDRIEMLAEKLAAEMSASSNTYAEAYNKIKHCQDAFNVRRQLFEKAGWYLKDMAFHQVEGMKPEIKPHLT